MMKNTMGFRIKRLLRGRGKAAACAVLTVLMFAAVHIPAAVTASSTQRQLPIYCVQRDQKVVAISFDAAWGNGILR